MCGLSLLLVLSLLGEEFVVGSLLAPRSFSPGIPVFASRHKLD